MPVPSSSRPAATRMRPRSQIAKSSCSTRALNRRAKTALEEPTSSARACNVTQIGEKLIECVQPYIHHTAFIHDFSNYEANCETDRQAIEALGAALAGSDCPLIVTSGTALLTPGRLAIEENVPASGTIPHVASEEAATSVAARSVRVAVVRLPPTWRRRSRFRSASHRHCT
jgi:hypothetical protein